MRRRSFIALGLGSSLLAWLASRSITSLAGLQQSRLTPTTRVLFASVAGAVLQGSLPTDPTAAYNALDGMLGRIDELIAQLPPASQAELSQLTGLLCTTPGRRLLVGLESDWPEAGISDVQAALEDMRHSHLAPRQQAYQALRDIVSGAYFADASTWPVIGYPGPMAI